MDNPKKTAFVASDKLMKRLKKLQEEMKLGTSAEVVSLALSLLEISMGREVELNDNSNKTKFRISNLAKYNQTISFDDEDNGGSS